MVPGAPSSAYKAKDEDVHRKAVFCSHHGRKVSPNKAKKGGEADGGDGRKRAIRGATSCSKVSDRLLLQLGARVPSQDRLRARVHDVLHQLPQQRDVPSRPRAALP